MIRAIVALGANLGDRGTTLREAAASIVALPGVRAVASSHEVESVAVTLDGPDPSKPPYRNAVVIVDTDLDPHALLDALHGIEDAAGRTRTVRWGDRTLDLDVVALHDASGVAVIIDDAVLTVPHPRAAERDFVLAPWLDADPDAVLPVPAASGVAARGTTATHRSVADLLAALGDHTTRVGEPRLLEGIPA